MNISEQSLNEDHSIPTYFSADFKKTCKIYVKKADQTLTKASSFYSSPVKAVHTYISFTLPSTTPKKVTKINVGLPMATVFFVLDLLFCLKYPPEN